MQRGHLESPTIALKTWGELNTSADNAVLIFTGLSPSAHAASSPKDPSAGWWEDMIGHGKPLDTDRYFIICINSLGSCFGSTGPASDNPETQKPYRLEFPVLTVEDIAISASHLLDHLGIDQLHTVVGASMGGMTALVAIIFTSSSSPPPSPPWLPSPLPSNNLHVANDWCRFLPLPGRCRMRSPCARCSAKSFAKTRSGKTDSTTPKVMARLPVCV